MNRRVKVGTGVIVVVIVTLVFGFYLLKNHMIAEKMASFQAPPVAVTTMKAKQSLWTTRIDAIGQITASAGVDVTPQIAGQVRAINFQSGDVVEEGQLLVQLDDQLDQDQLKRDLADVNLSQMDVNRYSTLVRENSAAQATLDKVRAKLVSDQAAAHATQTKINYMAIKAPFSGRLGIRQVNVGDFVQPGTELVNLQDTNLLYVDFSLPESYLPLLENGLQVQVISETRAKPYRAVLVAISSQVDPKSRNVDLRAELLDPDFALSPGMFATVTVVTRQTTEVIVLPAVAVSYSLYGDTVFVVSDPVKDGGDGKTKRFETASHSVTVFDQLESKVAITKGLKPGDEVITSNQQQLHKDS
ncbi:MAG: efflux RND transporter periplasmic adaptor subunit, partial [Halioglobus sp.]|nr:efflux RND transporter periplasmic adaptor subunit [Halioglobus sp.]